jgi:hypothetical protein
VNTRKFLIFVVCCLLLAGGTVIFLLPSPVLGDVGVQPILPSGSSLQPDEQTPVQMVEEVVKINVRRATKADNALVELNPDAYGFQPQQTWYPAVAEVEADFAMKNPTQAAIEMTAWFPLASALENQSWELNPDETVPRIASFQVMVGGKTVPYEVSEWSNPKGEDKPPLPWASFPVKFPADKQTVIQVSYMLPLWSIPKQTAVKLDYIFQTGACWDGPIRQAKLILNLPYPASQETLATIPEGAVFEGNKARWTWKNFEPGAEDDFTATLLWIHAWQDLTEARQAVQANPEEGQAWLDLGSLYRSLSLDMLTFRLMRFGPVFLPQGIETYQIAVELLPNHPVSHAGLALLTLGQYLNGKDKSPAVLQFIEDEYAIAKDLDAQNSSLLQNSGNSRHIFTWLEEGLHPYNEVTATAEAAEFKVEEATPTSPPSATAVPTQKPTRTPSPTSTPAPTETAAPSPTHTSLAPTATPIPTALPEQSSSQRQSLVIILAGGVVILGVVGYISLRRMRKRTAK